VDFESLNDHAVTIRERDTTAQERVPLVDLERVLASKIGF
jgi:glycyl-tRNA synthetase